MIERAIVVNVRVDLRPALDAVRMLEQALAAVVATLGEDPPSDGGVLGDPALP